MGISGLLPFVKPASTEKHIKDFKGQTAAVDSYCWLHKGAFGCADKLAMGEKTDGFILYCFKYIDMLLAFKIKPIMVFDGQNLPAKLLTEKKRRETRNQARKRATECLKLGNMAEARNNFRKCVDITPEMAFEMIKECRRRNIDCVVAPYEADAQLAYLNQTKIADFVITEDSDLLAFGCSKVLFKLDLTGKGTLVESDKLHLATKDRPDTFSFDKFRQMCILSGCDYLESLPGIGLKKAHKFLKNVSDDDIYNNMVKLPKILNMPTLVVTKEYRDQFMIADATFRHQLVFDVIHKKLVPLTDPNKYGTNEEYLCNAGKMLDDNLAYQIAVGNYNPFNHEVLSDWTPQQSNFSSIWCRSSYTTSTSITNKKTDNIFKPEMRTSIKIEKPLEHEIVVDEIEQKILMMYSVTKIEKNTHIEDSEERPSKKIRLQNDIKEEKSPRKSISPNKKSPILTGRKQFINPFLKKNKNLLASLNKTEDNLNINKQTVVVSKYFSSSTEEIDETITKTKRKSIIINENMLESIEKTKTSVETNDSPVKITKSSRHSKTNEYNIDDDSNESKTNEKLVKTNGYMIETIEAFVKTNDSPVKRTRNSRKSETDEYNIEYICNNSKTNETTGKTNETNDSPVKRTRNSRKSETDEYNIEYGTNEMCIKTIETNGSPVKRTRNSTKSETNEYDIEDVSNDSKTYETNKMCVKTVENVKTKSPAKTNEPSKTNYKIEEVTSDDEELQSSLKENDIKQNSLPSSSSSNSNTFQKMVNTKKFLSKTPMKCRPQGLMKPNSKSKFKPSKSQPTLVAMFAQWKKS